MKVLLFFEKYNKAKLIENRRTLFFSEIPPGINDVGDINNTLDKSVMVDVFIDVVRMKSRLKTELGLH